MLRPLGAVFFLSFALTGAFVLYYSFAFTPTPKLRMVSMRTLMMSVGAAAVFAVLGCLQPTTGATGEGCKRVLSVPVSTRGDTLVTATGLRYIQIVEGSGATVAATCRKVAVHYTGYLLDGTEFDSSRDRLPLEITLGTGAVIAGFDQGITGLTVGGKRRLIIPPALGYGSTAKKDEAGNVVIPPNSTLVFDVELIGFK